MSESLEARAQRLLNRDAAPGGLIRFPMNCSIYVRPSVAVAAIESGGKTLRLLRSEYPQTGGGQIDHAVLPSLGKFSIWADENWRCPWCGVRVNQAFDIHAFWQCLDCQKAGRPAFNCAGDNHGWFRCSYGKAFHNPSFDVVETFPVLGQREAPRLPPPTDRAFQPWSPLQQPAALGVKPSYVPPRASVPSSSPPPLPSTRTAPRLPASQPLRLKGKK